MQVCNMTVFIWSGKVESRSVQPCRRMGVTGRLHGGSSPMRLARLTASSEISTSSLGEHKVNTGQDSVFTLAFTSVFTLPPDSNSRRPTAWAEPTYQSKMERKMGNGRWRPHFFTFKPCPEPFRFRGDCASLQGRHRPFPILFCVFLTISKTIPAARSRAIWIRPEDDCGQAS